jgi:hypothetical protein
VKKLYVVTFYVEGDLNLVEDLVRVGARHLGPEQPIALYREATNAEYDHYEAELKEPRI